MLACLLGFAAFHGHRWLAAVVAGEPAPIRGEVWIGLAVAGLCTAVFLHGRAVAQLQQRLQQPEQTLRSALQRIRSGDLSFRVHLRRDDLLQDLAADCNALLDWLNANPPGSSRTGSDLVPLPLARRQPAAVLPAQPHGNAVVGQALAQSAAGPAVGVP